MSRKASNWAAVRSRDLMRRRGSESAKEDVPFALPLLPSKRRRPRPSKADLRSEADRLVAEFLKAKV